MIKAIKYIIQNILKLLVFDIHTCHRQVTKGTILKPEHLVDGHEICGQNDRLETDVRSTSGGAHPVVCQLTLQGPSVGIVPLLVWL